MANAAIMTRACGGVSSHVSGSGHTIFMSELNIHKFYFLQFSPTYKRFYKASQKSGIKCGLSVQIYSSVKDIQTVARPSEYL